MWDLNWDRAYKECSRWAGEYLATLDPQGGWPNGFQKVKDKLYWQSKLCVPLWLQGKIIADHHAFLGHVGFERQWADMGRKYHWANEGVAMGKASGMMKNCVTCQACRGPTSLRGPQFYNPVPPHIMDSVALDMFSMPKEKIDGVEYDQILLCVDRHSGWIVAVPCLAKGLTGAKAAKLILPFWRMFGVPSLITSDQGSHFISAWWQTLCACMGIRQAFSQAYHHQANGRAERAGKQIFERLRCVCAEEKVSWVEALPQVLDRIHDTPGETGMSPYFILFGRERPLGNIPVKPQREAEDAVQFFERQEKTDKLVAQILNEKHQKAQERANRGVKEWPTYKAGDTVWYLRPPDSGNKLDTRWLGPCVVKGREGAHSYLVEVKPGYVIKAPNKFLKTCEVDKWKGKPVPLFYHKRTAEEEAADPESWLVEKILGHRVEANGRFFFRVKWEGE